MNRYLGYLAIDIEKKYYLTKTVKIAEHLHTISSLRLNIYLRSSEKALFEKFLIRLKDFQNSVTLNLKIIPESKYDPPTYSYKPTVKNLRLPNIKNSSLSNFSILTLIGRYKSDIISSDLANYFL